MPGTRRQTTPIHDRGDVAVKPSTIGAAGQNHNAAPAGRFEVGQCAFPAGTIVGARMHENGAAGELETSPTENDLQ
jgi:hypothetical protein